MSERPEPQPPSAEPATDGPPPDMPAAFPAEGGRPDEAAAPAAALPTERPVPSRRPAPLSEPPAPTPAPAAATSDYVLTVDEATGYVTACERLDRQTGERRPLTNEECALAMTFAALGAGRLPFAASAGHAFATGSDPSAGIIQAYYTGALDYLNAVARLTQTADRAPG